MQENHSRPKVHIQIRSEIRQQRRSLNAAAQQLAAKQLRANLKQLAVVRRAKHIALYIANDGEIDPGLFMQWAWSVNKHCYLPVLSKQKNQPMRFAEVMPSSRFVKNIYGIDEPNIKRRAPYGTLLGADKLDLILMPLVAFDTKGNRLGMGGGFYDQTLAFRRRHPYYQRPKLIGLAHAFQQIESIKVAHWDVPLDGIATETFSRLFSCKEPLTS